MELKKIEALIQLLDDPSPLIFNEVKTQLLLKGEEAVPALEQAWERSTGELIQTRLEEIVQKIHFNTLSENLREWSQNERKNLFKGAYYIASYQYPELDYSTIYQIIESIKNDVWIELNENLTALEKVKVLNHIIYGIYSFKRNNSNQISPRDSYINDVLNSKLGNPVSLGIIYITIAQLLELPVYGVNLPMNFILAYIDEYDRPKQAQYFDHNILFYINPFNSGAVFGKREINYFIEQQKLEKREEYYKPCSNISIISRHIDDIIKAYKKQGEKRKVEELRQLIEIIKL